MANNAALAIIADGGRAIVVIYTEGEEMNYFLLYFIDSDKTLRWRPRPTQPLAKRLPGWGMFLHQNHGAGGENGSIMVGMSVCLCLASQNPFGAGVCCSRQNGLR